MSYTPPAGGAANFDFSAFAGYAPPAGGAADFDFEGTAGIQALVAAPTMLGAPAVLAASVRAAWAGAPTMLGSPAVLGRAFELVQARAAAPSMLGEPAVLGTAGNSYLAWAAAPSPLGGPVARPQLAVASDDFSSGSATSRPVGNELHPTATWEYLFNAGGMSLVDGCLTSSDGRIYLFADNIDSEDENLRLTVRVKTTAYGDDTKRRFFVSYAQHNADWSEYKQVIIAVSHLFSTIKAEYWANDGFDSDDDVFVENAVHPGMGDTAEYTFLFSRDKVRVVLGGIEVYAWNYPAGVVIDGFNYIDFDSYYALDNIEGSSEPATAASGGPTVLGYVPNTGRVAAPSMLQPPTVLGASETPPYAAAGWQAIQFGAPYGANAYRAATFDEVTRFGAPTTPSYTEHQAQGFSSTRFGVPYGLLPFDFEPVNQTTSARGWMAAQFGTPAGQANFTGQAQGWQAAQFGTPRYAAVLTAEPLGVLTQFGTPTAGSGHRAQGFRPTQFGTPTCAAGYLAQGFSRARFGTPRASLPGALVARGWCSTRFGTPRGSLPPPGHAATSFSTTQFGVPVATIRHRAATVGPMSRFGRPTLKRTPTC